MSRTLLAVIIAIVFADANIYVKQYPGMRSSNGNDVQLHLLGSNMVLQRDSLNTKIIGAAGKAGNVKVELIEGGSIIETYTVQTVEYNIWTVVFKPRPASGPFSIVVTSPTSQVKYNNVMFGDVFLCSGQSNSKLFIDDPYS